MPLPPYLSSAASSRAHHALLVKCDGTTSMQAEDAVLHAEVERCRSVLVGAPSSSRIASTLIILLHCATMARTPLDLEFALMPALQLAEGGRSMSERRTGYLYLAERLPPGHELHLMLINTIRKDLASTSEAHILAALHVIAHLPSPDLAPAVVPLLTSKRLLEHPVPAVRQRTVQAIAALSSAEAPLSLREMARRIRHEDDDSVLSALLRLLAQAMDAGAREADPARRRRQLDSVFGVCARKMDADSPLVIAAIRALVAIVRTLPRQLDGVEGTRDALVKYATDQTRALLAEAVELHTTPGVSPWARACLLETSALATALYDVDRVLGEGVDTLLGHLRRFLLPDKGKGKATAARSETQARDSANNRILALRCFAVLPAVAWQDGLTEAHMSALMGGVDSSEPTVRTETLRLLRLADRNLPQLTLDSHLEAVRTGRGLPLPHDVNPSKSEKAAVAEGRAEAACRALEVAGVVSEGLTDEERGERLAETVATISSALRTGNPKHRVWLEGVQTVIADLNASPAVFRRAFLDALARHLASDPADPTAAVLVTTAAVEYPVGDASASIDALIAALPAAAPSVQELVVLALVPLLARLRDRSEATARVVAALKAVADDPGVIRHMAKRCAEVVLIVERDLVDAVVQRSKSRALNDVLDAILSTYAEATKPSPRSSGSASPNPGGSKRLASSLRYDAYDVPRSGSVSGSGSRSGSPRSPRSPTSPRVRSPLSRAAELSGSTWAMGRSALVKPEAEDLAMDDLAIRGSATPTDRTPRLRSAEPRLA